MKMTERERLIKEMGELVKPFGNGIQHKLSYTMKRWELELVADYIIADRQAILDKVCAPLVIASSPSNFEHTQTLQYAIKETLNLAEEMKGKV